MISINYDINDCNVTWCVGLLRVYIEELEWPRIFWNIDKISSGEEKIHENST